jgi:malonyl-CoA O-methyltransferase
MRWLYEEIAQRMVQKLEIVKLQPQDVLLVPDFVGGFSSLLRRRFPQANMHGAGVAPSFLETLCLWFSRRTLYPLESHQALVLPKNSQDLIFSVLWLQDCVDPRQVIAQFWSALREEGLLSLGYLGPDTGKELKAVQMPSGVRSTKLISPWDMHDFGDALIRQGFSDPVMDMEFLTLEYESPILLLRDAQALGLIQGQNLDAIRMDSLPAEFPKKLTLEVVYGHAWILDKHLSRGDSGGGEVTIGIDQIGRKPPIGQ